MPLGPLAPVCDCYGFIDHRLNDGEDLCGDLFNLVVLVDALEYAYVRNPSCGEIY